MVFVPVLSSVVLHGIRTCSQDWYLRRAYRDFTTSKTIIAKCPKMYVNVDPSVFMRMVNLPKNYMYV